MMKKKRSNCYIIFFVWTFIALLSSCGPRLNSEIKNGYYIDYDNNIKFKIPPNSNFSGVYSQYALKDKRYVSSDKRHVDISWQKNSAVYSRFLIKVHYEELKLDVKDPIKAVIENEIRRIKEGDYYKNLKIIAKDVPQGRIVFSFDETTDWLGRNEVTTIEIVKYAIKDNFLTYVRYRNFEKEFSRKTVDKIMDDILESFEAENNPAPK